MKGKRMKAAGYFWAVLGVGAATLLLKSFGGQINPTTAALALLLVVLFVAPRAEVLRQLRRQPHGREEGG